MYLYVCVPKNIRVFDGVLCMRMCACVCMALFLYGERTFCCSARGDLEMLKWAHAEGAPLHINAKVYADPNICAWLSAQQKSM